MIVLDTHVLIWFVQGDERLGADARAAIEQHVHAGEAYLPAICVWELALLERRAAVALSMPVKDWLDQVLDGRGVRLAPLEPRIAVQSVQLDWAHKDPADRMIVATARALACPLLTADRMILAYGGQGHLRVEDARV